MYMRWKLTLLTVHEFPTTYGLCTTSGSAFCFIRACSVSRKGCRYHSWESPSSLGQNWSSTQLPPSGGGIPTFPESCSTWQGIVVSLGHSRDHRSNPLFVCSSSLHVWAKRSPAASLYLRSVHMEGRDFLSQLCPQLTSGDAGGEETSGTRTQLYTGPHMWSLECSRGMQPRWQRGIPLPSSQSGWESQGPCHRGVSRIAYQCWSWSAHKFRYCLYY